MKIMLANKIKGKITRTNPGYEGSITIGRTLLNKVSSYGFPPIVPYEQVHVLNVTTGARLITYAIMGEGEELCLNGAAARQGQVGDEVIVLSYEVWDR